MHPSNPSPASSSYGRLNHEFTSIRPRPPRPTHLTSILFLITVFLLIIAASILTTLLLTRESRSSSSLHATKPITRACGVTRYPDLCVTSLVEFPGAMDVTKSSEVVHLSVNMTLDRFKSALSKSVEIRNFEMDSLSRSAYDDCVELLDESVELLSLSLGYYYFGSNNQGGGGGASTDDVITWLSAALTNQDTCTEGLSSIKGNVREEMTDRMRDLSELVSNCLAIYTCLYSNGNGNDFSGVPIDNRRRKRRLLAAAGAPTPFFADNTGFPKTDREMLLLLAPTAAPMEEADLVVAKDGSGMVKTIEEAIKKAPQKSNRRFIIHIKAGRYEENNLKVGRKKTNLWFIGDGKGRTVITGGKNVARDNITTFHTASFAATGTGFVAKDITFENYAGPNNHQAVALRVGSDHAVIYRCEIKGYQDTLYVHSNRQFYRDCDIYGTVDFIFGNAAVVFQHCNIYSRKPLPNQKITITAQNRKDPNQNTGMSIHACQILPTLDLQPVKLTYPTFLGRPWKPYSRVVYMLSYIGDHVDPKGWIEWNATMPVDKVYYGEYMNGGAGVNVSERVHWSGLHLNMTRQEASRFTVAQFIYGSVWLIPTGVAFQSGLTA